MATMAQRARWADDRYQYPAVGTEGDVWESEDYDNPDSPEYQALCFLPDGEEEGVYCGDEHLEFLEPAK